MGLFYRAMNAVHVTTREPYIRSELFFEEGDCFDPFLLTESERVLRALDFIATARITEAVQSDGTRQVRVVVRDDISIKLSLGVAIDDGFTFENVALAELNFLGRGMTVGVFRREQRETLERGIEFGSPRFIGSPLDFRISGGSTRDGSFARESLFLPFLSERSRVAARQTLTWEEQPFAYSLTPGLGFTHVLMPVQSYKAELIGAFRWGEQGNLFWVASGLAWDGVDYPDYPDGVQGVVDKDFKNPVEVPDTAVTEVASQAVPQNATRVTLMASRRDVVFTRRRRLDAVDAVEDVRIGTEIVATVAPSVPILELGDHPAEDAYARLEVFAGSGDGEVFWTTEFVLEGRALYSPQEEQGRWQDILAELNAVVFWQPSLLENDPGRHTLALKASYVDGQNTTRPFQLTLGGRDGVRGYSRDAFPGGKRALFTVEDRIFLGWPHTQLFDVGASAFIDVGRMWARDAPFGVDSGWKASIGIGLRIGAPAGGNRTTRIELMLPLEGDPGEDAAYLRFYADLGSVISRFRSEQVERSRFSGISSDLVNRPRRAR